MDCVIILRVSYYRPGGLGDDQIMHIALASFRFKN